MSENCYLLSDQHFLLESHSVAGEYDIKVALISVISLHPTIIQEFM